MHHCPSHDTRRRGATIPLFAILLVPLMGMLAFSIDIGWIALVKTDLQTAADAAAERYQLPAQQRSPTGDRPESEELEGRTRSEEYAPI
jgi:Flp pilus assembly protein TadG